MRLNVIYDQLTTQVIHQLSTFLWHSVVKCLSIDYCSCLNCILACLLLHLFKLFLSTHPSIHCSDILLGSFFEGTDGP